KHLYSSLEESHTVREALQFLQLLPAHILPKVQQLEVNGLEVLQLIQRERRRGHAQAGIANLVVKLRKSSFDDVDLLINRVHSCTHCGYLLLQLVNVHALLQLPATQLPPTAAGYHRLHQFPHFNFAPHSFTPLSAAAAVKF
ncbi:hypothetical protein M758_5G082500, partial [Ceratodon purpureus]